MSILVIDDCQQNLDLLSHMITAYGNAPPVQMIDAPGALAWCERHEPDLVLVDYMMPGMDGLEFLRRFRAMADYQHIPVIMITASNEVAVMHEALRLSANDLLTKPVNAAELAARVRNLLATRQSQLLLISRAATLAEEVRLATAEIEAREREAIYRLSRAAEYRDTDTGNHLLRMAAFSELIARNLGMGEAECELIRTAAPMHDIGKLGVPDAILLKPGRLTPEEMVIMRRHAQIGADILAGSKSKLLQAGAVIAATHHERFDGTGYPSGLRGEQIPLYGRIVAVADVFDALCSKRPYKEEWPIGAARASIVEESGSHFDPVCVDALFRDEAAISAIRVRYQVTGAVSGGRATPETTASESVL